MSTTTSMRIGARMVANIISSKQHAAGLTSKELFQLVKTVKPPANFTPNTTFVVPANHRKPPPAPPLPDHPVQSLNFLKNTVLPMLANKKYITCVQTTRIPSRLASRKGKDKAEEQAEPQTPIKLWVWKKIDQRTLPSRKPPPPRPVYGTEVGAGQDISHLSRRRQRSRLVKIRRDVKLLRIRDAKDRARQLEEEKARKEEAKRLKQDQRRARIAQLAAAPLPSTESATV